jgi:hypothetical protein
MSNSLIINPINAISEIIGTYFSKNQCTYPTVYHITVPPKEEHIKIDHKILYQKHKELYLELIAKVYSDPEKQIDIINTIESLTN